MAQYDLYTEEDAPSINFDEIQDEPLPQDPPVLQRTSTWQITSPKKIVILLGVLKFCIVCSGLMIMMPMYRLIEDALCHAHFEDDSADLIDEMECKVDEVQQRLAALLGWLGLLGALINLMVAYPYGLLADTIGRKPTLMLSYGGVAISFLMSPFMLGTLAYAVRRNPSILVFGSFMQIIGGGVPVIMSTLYSVASDVSTDENKASNFIYLAIGATVGGTLGPLISGLLMSKFGPWMPIYIVAATVPFVMSIFLLLPETLTIKAETQQSEYQPPLVAMKNRISEGLIGLRRSLEMMRNINIPLILVCFFFNNARFTAYTSTLTQYISKHFGWTLAETSVLLSPLSVVNLIMLASLPKLSEWLMARYRLSTFGKDIWLTRTSYFILAFAAWVEGLSRHIGPFLFGLFINTFGAAEAPLARATVSHFVEPGYTSRMYALLGMTEVLGSFTGAPVLAWCFNKGLELKGFWTGLPWYYLGLLSSITLTALMFVRPPRKDWSRWTGDDDEVDDFPPDNPVRLD